jgi:hypothetical protein
LRAHTGAPNTLRRARRQRTLDQPSRTAAYDIRDTCWGFGTTLPLGPLHRYRLPRERSRKGPYSNAERDTWCVFMCGVSLRTLALSGVLKHTHTQTHTQTSSTGCSMELTFFGSHIL